MSYLGFSTHGRDSRAQSPVIYGMHTWDFFARSCALASWSTQHIMYAPKNQILYILELENTIYVSGYPDYEKYIRLSLENLKPKWLSNDTFIIFKIHSEITIRIFVGWHLIFLPSDLLNKLYDKPSVEYKQYGLLKYTVSYNGF